MSEFICEFESVWDCSETGKLTTSASEASFSIIRVSDRTLNWIFPLFNSSFDESNSALLKSNVKVGSFAAKILSILIELKITIPPAINKKNRQSINNMAIKNAANVG